MVSMGIERLQQLVHQPLEIYVLEETGYNRVMAETSDSESSAERGSYRGRGRRKDKKERKERKHIKRSRSPSTSPSRSQPRCGCRSRESRSTSRKPAAKDTNPKNCPFCKEFGVYGLAHTAPKNVLHKQCNYNKKWKGWRP